MSDNPESDSSSIPSVQSPPNLVGTISQDLQHDSSSSSPPSTALSTSTSSQTLHLSDTSTLPSTSAPSPLEQEPLPSDSEEEEESDYSSSSSEADDCSSPAMTGSSLSRSSSTLALKIVVIGNVGVGKTSVVRRYCLGDYSDLQQRTIGVDFALKVLPINHRTVSVSIWDVAGEERFKAVSASYYRGSHGALVCFDIVSRDSFDEVIGWKRDMLHKLGYDEQEPNDFKFVLLANKFDLRDRSFLAHGFRDMLTEFCEKNGFIGWFPTSAKKNFGIDEAVEAVVKEILSTDEMVRLQSELDERARSGELMGGGLGREETIRLEESRGRGGGNRGRRRGRGRMGGNCCRSVPLSDDDVEYGERDLDIV